MKVTMILLAAGGSRRYGKENKLLAEVNGRPMYHHILERLNACRDVDTDLVVVTNTEEIRLCCDRLQIHRTDNRKWEEGISSSIRKGLTASSTSDAYVFFVADQPGLKEETIRRFLRECREKQAEYACVTDGAQWGNPCWFSASAVPLLMELRGDVGGKQILRRQAEKVVLIHADTAELRDIDKRLEE